MSINFGIQGGAYSLVDTECYCCDGTMVYAGGPCVHCKNGITQVAEPEVPDVQFSNANARDFLVALGETPECYGIWESDRLLVIRDRLVLLSTAGVDLLVKDLTRDGNMIHCGRDEDYVRRRATQLLALVRSAIEKKLPVSWG